MNLLFCGDVVGQSGVNSIINILPNFKRDYKVDFVIVNGENAEDGYGILPDTCEELFSKGVDVITSGNHIWDRQEIIPYIAKKNNLLRPLNYSNTCPGNGSYVYNDQLGNRVLVINIMCQLFMNPLNCPFETIEKILANYKIGETITAISIDLHGEASSEKMAIAHAFDGRVTMIIGTHTHVPTSDLQILNNGTTYQTDAGMCGDYNSVIGGEKQLWVDKFRRKMPVGKIRSARGNASFCGVLVDINTDTGFAYKANQVIIGGVLKNRLPNIN